MGWSRVFWAIGTVAPWCLGAGLAVSFPAGAGQDAAIGGNILALTARPLADPSDIVPAMNRPAILSGITGANTGFLARIAGFGPADDQLVHSARLVTGNEGMEFEPVPDEIEPRIKLKNKKSGFPKSGFPKADRSKRSDPFIGLRPTFDAKLRKKGSFRRFIARQQAFSGNVLGFKGFLKLQKPAIAAPAQAQSQTPAQTVTTGQSGQTRSTSAVQASSATPSRNRLVTNTGLSRDAASSLVSRPVQHYLDGASPRVSRAVALSSATPEGADAAPRVITARALLPARKLSDPAAKEKAPAKNKSRIARSGKKPNYLAMIKRASTPAQRKCLAQGIYFEARSESRAGQAAVAQVILNRTMSRLYPNSVCGVVFQNSHRYKACQFTFTCEGKSLRIRDRNSWAIAVQIAKQVLEGQTYLAKVGGSTHYHATYVRPRWAKRLRRMNKIGTHIFYKLKPGQT